MGAISLLTRQKEGKPSPVMALNKVCLVALMGMAVSARPQNQPALDTNDEPFDPNPVYTYSYQVSDDHEQTYMQKEENRNGDELTGKYQYVDALGQLIVVTYRSYRAGPEMG